MFVPFVPLWFWATGMPHAMKHEALLGIMLAALLLAAGYAVRALWPWALGSVAIGGLWVAGQQRGWGWTATPGMVGLVGLTTAGIFLGLPVLWMLACATAALVAWDLSHFAQRLSEAGRVEDTAALQRARRRRLAIVAGLGLLLGGTALIARVELGFGIALLLGLLAIVGLSRAVVFMRRESD